MREHPDAALGPQAVAPGDGGAHSLYAFAERLFVEALVNGVIQFQANARHWDALLGFIDEIERANVRRVMEARPPSIRHGYARDGDPWPVIGVTLGSEVPNLDVAGGVLAVADGVLELGEVRTQNLDLTIYADNPDLALYLYHWTNYVLLAHTDWLHRQGLMMPQFTSGQELAPDPRYLPETCYLRRATWQVTGEVYAAIPMRDPPGRVYAANPTAVVDGHRGLIRTGGAE